MSRVALSPGSAESETADDWSQIRLHIVTGKGGAGKTTVATALALTVASLGKRVLLAEVEGRQGIAQALDVPPLGTSEQRVVRVSGGGEVWGLAVEAKAALIEYLSIFYHLGSAGGVLEKLGAIDFATTIAPGVRDVLCIGKVYEAVGRRGPSGAHAYDVVILDAPPTGRIASFLNVNEEVAELAKVGPIRNQADSITRMLHARSCAVHIVTLLEEMPIQESIEAVAELRRHGLPLGAVVVNQARDALVEAEAAGCLLTAQVDLDAVAAQLSALGVIDSRDDGRSAAALLTQARGHVERLALEDEQLAALDDLGLPVYVLPHILDPTGASSVRELAQELAGQAVWG
ncbi:MAG: ArsA-related P-loop ATPase [Micrococcales bacterium]|nr:ArsA-related P-loop ATPase [Micrococcales bacterium]